MKQVQVAQLNIPVTIVAVILVAVVSWAAAYFGNLNAQAAATSDLKADIKILQSTQGTQDEEIKTLTGGLSKINDNVVKLLIHNGLQPVK